MSLCVIDIRVNNVMFALKHKHVYNHGKSISGFKT